MNKIIKHMAYFAAGAVTLIGCDMLSTENLPEDAIVTQPDNVELKSNEAIVIAPMGNDVVFSAGTMQISTAPTNGTATTLTGGLLLYRPNADFTGEDEIEYEFTAHNTPNKRHRDKIKIKIKNQDDSVVVSCGQSTYSAYDQTRQDKPKKVWVGDKGFFCDAKADLSSMTIVIKPQHGTVSQDSSGTYIYNPASGFVGSDFLTYTLLKEGASANDTLSMVTIVWFVDVKEKEQENCELEAHDDHFGFYTSPDSTGKSFVLDVLRNDKICDSTVVTLQITEMPRCNARVENNTIIYTPLAGETKDHLKYEIISSTGKRSGASVEIEMKDSLGGGHCELDAHDDEFRLPVATGLESFVLDVLRNDKVCDSTVVTLQITEMPRFNARVENNTIIYTPLAGETKDHLKYEIVSSTGKRSGASVEIEMKDSLDGGHCELDAHDDEFRLPAATGLESFVLDVLRNDKVCDSTVITLQITEMPHSNARVENNTIIYTPSAGETKDHLKYEIVTSTGKRSGASVEIEMKDSLGGGCDPEHIEARKDEVSFSYSNDSSTVELRSIIIGVLDNDELCANLFDDSAFIIVEQPMHGTVSITTNKAIVYTVEAGYEGRDHFSYQIGHTNGKKSRAGVEVEIEKK